MPEALPAIEYMFKIMSIARYTGAHCDSGTLEEAGGSGVQGHPGLHKILYQKQTNNEGTREIGQRSEAPTAVGRLGFGSQHKCGSSQMPVTPTQRDPKPLVCTLTYTKTTQTLKYISVMGSHPLTGSTCSPSSLAFSLSITTTSPPTALVQKS